ncbi:MAG: hypothetical protein ACYSW3_25980 [Planctomycetota bacterium]|jgi:hypothetical protein
MKRIVIGIVVTVVSALLVGVTGWNFAATQGAVQKKEHIVVHDRQDDKIDKVQRTADEIKNLILDLHTKDDE